VTPPLHLQRLFRVLGKNVRHSALFGIRRSPAAGRSAAGRALAGRACDPATGAVLTAISVCAVVGLYPCGREAMTLHRVGKRRSGVP
jgi:hypothetical protein